jgi:hypothetical protein|eukprot:COSAG02_NODE_2833_length_7927_cov_16.291007_4_plen_64_part_00
MVVIARKVLTMLAFEMFVDIHAWLLGTAVLLVSVVLHVYARPCVEPIVLALLWIVSSIWFHGC